MIVPQTDFHILWGFWSMKNSETPLFVVSMVGCYTCDSGREGEPSQMALEKLDFVFFSLTST